MFAMIARFTLPEATDWDAVPTTMQDRAHNLYADMPGLISKAFVYDPTTRDYGGNYVWESREAIDSFLRSETFLSAVEKFGQPRLEIHPIAAYVDRGRVVVPEAPLATPTPDG